MQKMIYECDQCKNEIGLHKHISLVFAGNQNATGIALPPTIDTKDFKDEDLLALHISDDKHRSHWTVAFNGKLRGKFMHFCNATCLSRFFSDLLKRADKKVVK